jgi:hypothetical protein
MTPLQKRSVAPRTSKQEATCQNIEAGRGRHLAPAPEFVSADASERSPAPVTKQARCTHAYQQAFKGEAYDCGDDAWILLAVMANKVVSDSGKKVQKRQIERRSGGERPQ